MVDLSALEQQFSLPQGLLSAVQQQESGGNPNAVSPAGALGAFQFMPDTAKQYGIDPKDPDQAAYGAAKMYSDLLDKYQGDVPSALAAYNWGQGNVDKKGLPNAPAETKNYIASIMGAIGDALVPPAQAAEMPSKPFQPPQTPQGQYDGMSDDQLLAEAQKQGIIPKTMNNDIGASPNVPVDQQVQSSAPQQLQYGSQTPQQQVAGDVAQEAQKNPYEGMSDQQLAEEAKKQGISTQLPTGREAYIPELKSAASSAVDTISSGMKNVKKALSPLAMMAEIAGNGQVSANTAKDLMSNSSPLEMFSNLIKGGGDAAMGALGLASSPVTAGNKAFVGNPVENATGIPSGVTDAVLGLAEPWGISKIAKVASGVGAAADITESQQAKDVADKFYDLADAKGGVIDNPNSLMDAFKGKDPVTPTEIIASKSDPVRKFAMDYADVRSAPLTLRDAQILDEELSNRIEKEYGIGGMSKDGQKLLEAQSNFRQSLANAPPETIGGGTEGYQAWKDGQKAWQQAMKLQDLERIQTRADSDLTDNPATAIKSGIRTLLSNPARVRGYSPQEIKALKQAADRGVLGSTFHVFGSRLIPMGAAFVGESMGGLPGAAVSGLIGHGLSSVLRGGATRIQAGKLSNAAKVLGRGVPGQ